MGSDWHFWFSLEFLWGSFSSMWHMWVLGQGWKLGCQQIRCETWWNLQVDDIYTVYIYIYIHIHILHIWGLRLLGSFFHPLNSLFALRWSLGPAAPCCFARSSQRRNGFNGSSNCYIARLKKPGRVTSRRTGLTGGTEKLAMDGDGDGGTVFFIPNWWMLPMLWWWQNRFTLRAAVKKLLWCFLFAPSFSTIFHPASPHFWCT